jgi:2-iminoacetate synthase ThiH
MKTPVYKSIYLYLTHACNAGCSFCYRRGLFERNKREALGPAFMSEAMAFRILDFVFSQLGW